MRNKSDFISQRINPKSNSIETLDVNEKVDHSNFNNNLSSQNINIRELCDDNYPVKTIHEECINSNAEKGKESKRVDEVPPKEQMTKPFSDENSNEQKISESTIKDDMCIKTVHETDTSRANIGAADETKGIDMSPNKSYEKQE